MESPIPTFHPRKVPAAREPDPKRTIRPASLRRLGEPHGVDLEGSVETRHERFSLVLNVEGVTSAADVFLLIGTVREAPVHLPVIEGELWVNAVTVLPLGKNRSLIVEEYGPVIGLSIGIQAVAIDPTRTKVLSSNGLEVIHP